MTSYEGVSAEMATCIQNCRDCYATCVLCIANHSGEPMMAECIASCLDCVETARACIHLMLTGSALQPQGCALQAAAAERCYNECKRHDNPFCRQCAEACERSLASCRAMAA